MTNKQLKDVVWVSFLAAIMVIFEIIPGIRFPFLPGFLSMSFTILPALIATFAIGPKYATAAIILGLLGKIVFVGSGTAYVGELADFIIWTAVVWVVGTFYKKSKIEDENKRTIVSLLFGVLTWIIIAVLANIFILVPFFIRLFFGGNTSSFVGAISIIPGVNEYNFMFRYIIFATIPFALIQTSILFTLTFLLHKRIKELYLNT